MNKEEFDELVEARTNIKFLLSEVRHWHELYDIALDHNLELSKENEELKNKIANYELKEMMEGK